MTALQVFDLSRSYNRIKAVNNVSFDVNPGEIVGFIGPNGSGKTTTFRCILDIIKRDSGIVKINGYAMPRFKVNAMAGTACWMEISHLYYDLTAADHIDFVQDIHSVPKETVKKYVEIFDVGSFLNLKVHKYSYGMKQRLGLTLAAMTEPKLLLLDEPTNGLDPVGIMVFREVLLSLAKEKGTAIFFSSHTLSELEKVVDRALFIKKGEIVHTEENDNNHVYKIKTADIAKAMRLLAPLDVNAESDGEYITFINTKSVDPVLSALYANGVAVLDVEKKETDLEKIFYSLYERPNLDV